MKLLNLSSLITLAFVLVACDKWGNADRFAGFTAVNTDNETAQFYIDTNTVRKSHSGLVSFNMVRVLPIGYAIQDAETDCKTKFNAFEGVKFRDDGTSEEKFIAETSTLPNKDNSDINALVAMACDKAEENRIITGTFDNAKALEILRESDQKAGSVKLFDSKDFTQQGSTKHMVLFASTLADDTKKEWLSAAVFVKKGDNWHIENEYPYLKAINDDDMSKNVRWERIGNDNYGIIEELPDQIYLHVLDAGLLKTAIHYQPPKNDNNVKSLSITFFDTDKYYSSALAIADYDSGDKLEQAYQFQSDRYVPLDKIALKEFVDVSVGLSNPLFELSFKYGDDHFHVVFIKTKIRENGRICDYHACGVDIGQVTYQLSHGVWNIVSKQKKIGVMGESGDAVVNHPAQLIETTKNNKLFFSLKHDGGGQGLYDYEGEYLLSFYKNNWKLFGSFITNVYHFNSSNIDTYNWKYTGKLSVINGQKEYPEFLLTKKGTEEDSKGNIIPAKNTIYVFNGKEYIEKQ